MGKVIKVKFRRHARTSARLKPNTAGSASFSMAARASENVINFSGGMAPRFFQLLTAGMLTPAKDAAAALPPTASITSLTELSMSAKYSHIVKMSIIHIKAVDECPELCLKSYMGETLKIAVGKRLRMSREALGQKSGEFAESVGCKGPAYSQYENGDRMLNPEIAVRIHQKYDIPLPWLYEANPAGLPRDLYVKIRKAKVA